MVKSGMVPPLRFLLAVSLECHEENASAGYGGLWRPDGEKTALHVQRCGIGGKIGIMVAIPLFETTFEPRSLVVDPPMTDAELEAFCLRSDNIQIERSGEGVIRMHAPMGGFTGNGNTEILRQLANWWFVPRRGRAYDSNTGFFYWTGLSCVLLLPMFCRNN